MKEKLVGNVSRGFNTLEIVLALAILLVVITGAVSANSATQYWSMTTQISTEALYKAQSLILQLQIIAEDDFQSASSSAKIRGEDPSDPVDATCIVGGLCYYTQKYVRDISSCAKFVEGRVEWKVSDRYATATESLYTDLTNYGEVSALGGDCILNELSGDWLGGTPGEVGTQIFPGVFSTGIDVFEDTLYVTSSVAPQLRIYSGLSSSGGDPVLQGMTNGANHRLNAVDVIRDIPTGKKFAYVTQHFTTGQLAVFDVTDPTLPVLVTERTLSGVPSTGSFPEGWRVFAYGHRLYVTTRETSGAELHIFDISTPENPVEIPTAAINLNRTVNDMLVREQKVEGVLRRYLFLASSSGLKEFALFDVTGDVPTEVAVINLPGNVDARSLFVLGNRLYVGRGRDSTGPELFAFDILDVQGGNFIPQGSSEVNATVDTIRAWGDVLLLGTTKPNEEFQVWHAGEHTWSTGVVNAGRVSYLGIPRIAPLGIDIGKDEVYLLTQSATLPERLSVIQPI